MVGRALPRRPNFRHARLAPDEKPAHTTFLALLERAIRAPSPPQSGGERSHLSATSRNAGGSKKVECLKAARSNLSAVRRDIFRSPIHNAGALLRRKNQKPKIDAI